MKTKITLSVLGLVLLCVTTYGQFSYGGGLSFNKFIGSYDHSFRLGINPRFTYEYDERTFVAGGVSIYVPNKYEIPYYAYAFSNVTSPSQLDLTGKVSSTLFHIDLTAGRTIFGTSLADNIFYYGFMGAGVMQYTAKYDLTYDKGEYYTTLNEDDGDKYFGFMVSGGLGADKELGFGRVYSELRLFMPAATVMGAEVEIEIPFSIGLNAGVRIPL